MFHAVVKNDPESNTVKKPACLDTAGVLLVAMSFSSQLYAVEAPVDGMMYTNSGYGSLAARPGSFIGIWFARLKTKS